MAEANRRQVAAYLATAAAGLASLGTSYGNGVCGGTVELAGDAELSDGVRDARRFRLRSSAPMVQVEVVVEVTSPKGLLDSSLRVDSATTASERLGVGSPVRLNARVPPCPSSQPCSPYSTAGARDDNLDVELTLRFEQVEGDSRVSYRVSATTEACGPDPLDDDGYYLELDAI